MKFFLFNLLSSLLLGLGCIIMLSPVFFYWWVHGSYERYVWIISGPAPYSSFGGGPYLLFVFFLLPVALGITLISVSVIIRRKLLK